MTTPGGEHQIVVGTDLEAGTVVMMTAEWQFAFSPEQAFEIGKMLILAADVIEPRSREIN